MTTPSYETHEVKLLDKSMAALTNAAELEQRNLNDTVNRALQAYEYFVQLRARGGKIWVQEKDSDELEAITWK